ncbi:MAG: class I SAM-dependent methyltransferase [Methylococcales bacterium]
MKHAFNEFRATDKSSGHNALKPHFDDLAPHYEETTEWRTDPGLLEQLRIDLPNRTCDILDIGSGTGLASQWYSEQGHRCVGVDLSPQMSVRAAPRVLFTTFGSALDLPFFDASFDLALMRQMLHYTEPALALQEAFRVIRSGGFLVAAAAIAPGDEVKPVWEEFKNVTQPLRLRVFSETDLIRSVEQAGFALLETRHGSLVRSESIEQLERRATAPSRGWEPFLSTMEKIFSSLAPQIEFKVIRNSYSYRQYWITVVSKKP